MKTARINGYAERAAVMSAAFLYLAFPIGGSAQTENQGLTWELALIQAYSDNIGLVADTPTEEFPLTGAGAIGWSNTSKRTQADLKVGAQRIQYLRNTFEDETRVQVDSEILYAIARERLTWRISDYFGQEPVNVQDQFNPVNNQDINVFQTGLDLIVPLGTRSHLNLDASHALSEAQVTDEFDSTHNNASIAWALLPSSRTELAIQGDYRRVEFKHSGISDDYDRRDSYLLMKMDRWETELTIEAGVSEVEFRTTRQDLEADLLRVRVERSIGSSRTLLLEYHDNLTDAATAFADRSSVETASTIVSGDIFRDRGWSAAYEAEWRHGAWSALAYDIDEEGFVNPLVDRESRMLQGEISFDLSPSLSMIVGVSAAEYDFPGILRTDKDRRLVTRFLRKVSSNMIISLEIGRTDIDSTDAAFDITETNAALSASLIR